MQEYDIAQQRRLIHIDAYRLSGEEELQTIGWDELLQAKDAIIAVEWPSRIEHALPENAIFIQIEHIDMNSRHINIK